MHHRSFNKQLRSTDPVNQAGTDPDPHGTDLPTREREGGSPPGDTIMIHCIHCDVGYQGLRLS